MPFGQPTGPPATPSQLRDLLALVQGAGHVDFRDARGPLGLTQRQAAGKFTRAEADELTARLEAEGTDAGPVDERPLPPDPRTERILRSLSDHELAAELERRGWVVIGP